MRKALVFFICLIAIVFAGSAFADDSAYSNFYYVISGRDAVFEASNSGVYYLNRIFALDNSFSEEPETLCLYPIWSKSQGTSWSKMSAPGHSGIYSYFSDTTDVSGNYYVHPSCFPVRAYRHVSPDNSVDICTLDNPNSLADKFASILPKTPENMRLPTLISNMGGQGSLAGNLAYELYSACWQYFGIIAAVKFYKLIPGKMT